ncbi:DUF559 domain-containing protein [Microbacterium aquimaris]|uniref:DUF559 domain-containing protein n=1 Tax=Microbacterium aquimaris TaxID=459816 RepID=UPI002AD47264|nr:DUF559 domain-containing protein [Microbacterium aquimaris]MDZ8275023.1 DUF559 domain-containing protein [Microbacterium aquimaris]
MPRRAAPAPLLARRRELRAEGFTDRDLARAVSVGTLLRPRRNAYLPEGAPVDTVDAVSLGGLLTCTAELRRAGVFVMDQATLDVHLPHHASRVPEIARPVRRHWGRLIRSPHPGGTSVEPLDAVACAVRCQGARAAVASIDSALHRGYLRRDDLPDLFQGLAGRYAVLLPLIDGRAESGPETLVRLILRSLGLRYEVQVQIEGVGRVDFLVEGWLIIECDSEEFHSDWDAQRRDRRRDQAAAARGFAVYRPIAEDIMWRSEGVVAAVRGLVSGPGGGGRARRAV